MTQYSLEEHHSLEEWVDFARKLTSRESERKMQRHLDEGCGRCAQVLAMWKRVMEAADRETDIKVPKAIVVGTKRRWVAMMNSGKPAPEWARRLRQDRRRAS